LPGIVCDSAVAPRATHGLPTGQGTIRRNTWPTIDPIDESFFEALAQNVAKAIHLAVWIGDDDRAISP
jgi:hypothetical protein